MSDIFLPVKQLKIPVIQYTDVRRLYEEVI